MAKFRYRSTWKVRGRRDGERPTLTIIETPFGGSGGSGNQTYKDAQFNGTISTTASNDFRMQVTTPFAHPTVVFRTTTPSVCTVDSTGQVRRKINGTATVIADTELGGLTYTRDLNQSTTVNGYQQTGWVAGSLGAHINSAIAAMVNAKTPGSASQDVLTASSGGYSNPNYVRNANLFTGALDLTAISVWGEVQNCNRFPVVLVSPWHVIAGHVGATPGYRYVFRASNGTYVVRTVVAQLKLAGPGDNYIAILDAAVSGITPMQLMSSTWASYWPTLNQVYSNLPVLNKGFTAGDRIRVLENYGANTSLSTTDAFLNLRKATSTAYASWSSDIIGGDSNGPVFVPINGNPVLLHCMNYASGGALYANITADIQTKMDTLSTTYGRPQQSLTYPNLTGFTTYP